MENQYRAIMLNSVNDFVNGLPETERGKVFSSMGKMRNGDWSPLYIKTLRGPIRELIVKQNRIIFFINQNVLYFVGAFRKKTAKTPLQEIEQAERVYRMFVH